MDWKCLLNLMLRFLNKLMEGEIGTLRCFPSSIYAMSKLVRLVHSALSFQPHNGRLSVGCPAVSSVCPLSAWSHSKLCPTPDVWERLQASIQCRPLQTQEKNKRSHILGSLRAAGTDNRLNVLCSSLNTSCSWPGSLSFRGCHCQSGSETMGLVVVLAVVTLEPL